jgi:TatA/E family protein of Tat protein translocase
MSLGWSEIAFIFVIALLVFGPKKLPEIGRTLGKGLREFKKATDDLKSNWEEHLREAENPINDIKNTIHEVQADVEASITHTEEQRHEDTPPPANEETKPDARPN